MIAALIDTVLLLIAGLIALAVQLWALIDCLIAKPKEFEATFKRTKGFWTGITAASAAVGVIFVFLPAPSFFLILDLAGCVGAGVYLADVRPALRGVRRPGGRNSGPYGRY